jgi:hypothetical protein
MHRAALIIGLILLTFGALTALRRGADTVAMGEEVFGVKTVLEGEPTFVPEAATALDGIPLARGDKAGRAMGIATAGGAER